MKKFASKNTGIIGSVELKSFRYKLLYWVLFGIMLLLVLISIVPSVWVMLSGFKDISEIYQIPPNLLPKTIRFSKIIEVWNIVKFQQSYLSNTMIMIGDTVMGILCPALGGYVLSRLQPKGYKLVFTLMLWTMMMPGQVRTVPLFMTFTNLNMIDTYWPMWLMAGANIFNTMLFKSCFDSISISYIEAARMDGCSNLKIFTMIMMPLAKSTIIVVAIFCVNNSWSSFLWPLLVLKKESMLPVTVKLYQMKDAYRLDQYMLALIFGMIPPMIFYIIFQRYILGGVNIGGIKG